MAKTWSSIASGRAPQQPLGHRRGRASSYPRPVAERRAAAHALELVEVQDDVEHRQPLDDAGRSTSTSNVPRAVVAPTTRRARDRPPSRARARRPSAASSSPRRADRWSARSSRRSAAGRPGTNRPHHSHRRGSTRPSTACGSSRPSPRTRRRRAATRVERGIADRRQRGANITVLPGRSTAVLQGEVGQLRVVAGADVAHERVLAAREDVQLQVGEPGGVQRRDDLQPRVGGHVRVPRPEDDHESAADVARARPASPRRRRRPARRRAAPSGRSTPWPRPAGRTPPGTPGGRRCRSRPRTARRRRRGRRGSPAPRPGRRRTARWSSRPRPPGPACLPASSNSSATPASSPCG